MKRARSFAPVLPAGQPLPFVFPSNFTRLYRRHYLAILVGMIVWYHVLRSRAENHVDYKFEDYREDEGRIKVDTQGVTFNQQLAKWMAIQGELVYDSISGATPTGAPPPAGSTQVPTTTIRDIRRAGNIEPVFAFGRQIIAPQFSYSRESDYESRGLALNYSLDLNQKNTTLVLGVSHDFDRVLPNPGEFIIQPEWKDATSVLIGLNQILTPKTIWTADLTYGYDAGYLNDPYKGVNFFFDYTTVGLPAALNPDPNAVEGEKRPRHRSKEIFYTAIRHHVDALDGSIEASYRFYHDSYGILAQTVGLTWFQNLSKHFILSPSFRYYDQNSADFYAVRFAGDPRFPTGATPLGVTVPAHPSYFSADYRLSSMHTITYGIHGTFKINDHFDFDVGFQRYRMIGDDNITQQSAYPNANIITVGLQIWY